jgi:RES domain-containing protein
VRVYRVFPYDPNAALQKPGGVLHVPAQGMGRIDNPLFYTTRYVSDSPAGACAEAFNYGRYRRRWSDAMFRGLRNLPQTRRALAVINLGDVPICDLNDPHELVAQALRPSAVITRDYEQSRAWALRLFQANRWSGVKWWSYHDARWASIGLWDAAVISVVTVEQLNLQHDGIVEAADVLDIQIDI